MADDAKSSAALAHVGLAAPVRELTRVPVDEWAVRRMWQGVERRGEGRGRPAGSKTRSVAWTALASAVAVLLVLFGARWWVPLAAQEKAVPPAAESVTRSS